MKRLPEVVPREKFGIGVAGFSGKHRWGPFNVNGHKEKGSNNTVPNLGSWGVGNQGKKRNPIEV